MKSNIPQGIVEIQKAQIIPRSTTMKATIKAGAVAKTGLVLENKTENYNNKNIIGIALRVNAASGTETSSNGNLLIEQNWADNTFLELKNGSTTILDNICIAQLIPPTGKNYVPVFIEIFSPSTSKFTFSGSLTDGSDDRDIELILIHSELEK